MVPADAPCGVWLFMAGEIRYLGCKIAIRNGDEQYRHVFVRSAHPGSIGSLVGPSKTGGQMTPDSDSDTDLPTVLMRRNDHATLRSITGVDRDVRKMPPGAVIQYAAGDMYAAVDRAEIAAAGRQLIEAREAVATAKARLGRAAHDAHYYAGCPLLTMAEMSGVDRHTISRCVWAYFDTPESPHGEGWRIRATELGAVPDATGPLLGGSHNPHNP